ncbi:gelsolin, cytoplasmic-like isoform X1 [Danaus plexippus]|uniref:gelsolin, cytoplasmic-like isoform X1 n=1 Tax=Danaus plexippus TaxID=13037 RepID=UPI002AB0767D|nr:gelsolin, cytoplasmic-like isoform X1 [Danaus plexippus]
MEHPAFEEAGQEPGLEIWTIDKFEPVPIPRKMYGKFYNGDSYIVLKTSGDSSSTLSYDIHFWLGSQSTQDEKGAAAILTITLDDKLGGKAVHHREVQGHETSKFMRYFQPAIRYLEGGNDSGFNEVETNAGAEKRLLKLSGCENMRIEEVPPEASSLTQDHCFILEVDHDIFVLLPDGAKATQRRKIISVANTLRDDYHNGRASIEIIDEFSSDDDYSAFFEALGDGCKDDLVADESSDTYSRSSVSAVYLYKVLLGDEIDLLEINKPFKQSQLTSEDIFILDTPCSGIYIWLGKDLDPDVRKTYNDIAQQYLDIKGYPSWVPITRVSEDMESSVFKQYFHRWDTATTTIRSVKDIAAEIDAGYFSGDADDVEAVARYIGKSAVARGYMPGGDGVFTLYRAGEEPEDITDQETAKLYTSEVYVAKYQYKNDNDEDLTVAYLWLGKDASSDDIEAGIHLLDSIEEESEGPVIHVKLPQGKENKHFLTLFKGNLIILCGDKENEYKCQNFSGSYDDDGIRLFKVEGTKLGEDMRAMQVEERSDNLEIDDVFILETPDVVYLWNGKDSSEKEQEAAKNFASLLFEEKEVTEVNQGDEPDEFWEVLGGAPEEKDSSWKQAASRRANVPPSLSSVTLRANGKLRFEELEEFSQTDLSDDGAFILDTGEELYLWLGKNTPQRVKQARLKIITDYIEDDGLERTAESAVVVTLRQGGEPQTFKNLFTEWDDEYFEKQTSYEDMKNETKAANSK